jgi:RHS repeat-associated protein
MTNDGINALVYDAENRVTSATNGSGSGTYTYDGNGHRVEKVGGGNTIVTILVGAQVLAEYYNGAAPSSPTNEYIYAGSMKIASIQSGTTDYWHNDHLSPRVRTDTSGNVADQRGTFPFGETWYTPNSSAPWVFTTYYRDVEAEGNDYAQARTYVGDLGRFSSPDPLAGSTSDPQSLNRYSYVRNMPVMLTDPFGLFPPGTCPPVAQNRNSSDSQDSKSGGGPSAYAGDEAEADPEPQQLRGCGWSSPWYEGGGGGGVSIDGGGVFFPGDGAGGLTGIGTDPFSILDTAFTPTSYQTVENPDCPNYDCAPGTPETINEPVYGNLWLLSLPSGWTIDPKDLILKVTRDCFNKNAGQREVTYQLATQSGSPLVGSYNITEQQSDTSLTPPNPWGQSSNYPELGEINVFKDDLQPGLFSSQTVKSTQYFLVSPGGLNIAQWVPISRPGQALSKFNSIVMKGPVSSDPNTVKINGHAAPLCGTT